MKMSTKFTCRFCKEQFDQPKGLYKHLQTAHSAGSSRDNRTCPICGVLCSKYESYRDHLLHIHGQENEGQKLTFKSLNDFLLWKTELEMKYSCKYNLQSTPKILPTKERKYFYQCDRSDSKVKDKKTLSVVMKTCASVISVFEGSGVLKVEYWDTHTNHDSLTTTHAEHELETAISSVEMVNAIGESDDSFDRSQEFIVENSSPVSHTDKQALSSKSQSSPSVNFNNSSFIGSVQKTKNNQPSGKDNVKKKSANTSILYSLASVACGKGISKKSANKLNSNKNMDSQSSTPELSSNSKHPDDASGESSVINDKPDDKTTSSVISSQLSGSVVTTTPSLSVSKTPGRPAIAPKISGSNAINSIFTANSSFPNQLVIVNPVGMDQNSGQNVFPPGQNILFSLGPLGQNILPANSSPQPTGQASSPGDKNKLSTDKKNSKAESPSNLKGKNTSTSPKKSPSTKLMSNNVPSTIVSTASSSSPITLTPNMNTAPVILSSLPVGSTFMSVNNNLIPIASPSGTFLPTSLPANIVLTPVPASSVASNKDSAAKTTFSSVVSSAPQITQSPLRFTSPSSVAITVSSVVREPMYTSTTVKQLNNIISTNIPSIQSASPSLPLSSKSSSKIQSKFIPITVANAISPVPNTSKAVAGAKATKSFTTNKVSPSSNKTVTPVSTIPSARKRASKSLLRQRLCSNLFEPNAPEIENTSIVSPVANTQVTNSQLNLSPITSAPNVSVTSPELNSNKLGTLLFESDGEIYMLEPVENDTVSNITLKNESEPQTIKIDRAMQTTENSNLAALKSRLQRKRPVPADDDSAVMMKVKCYQLEMKYLNCQTECKKLKIELTKEKMKNAELQGKPMDVDMDTGINSHESSRNRAQEIMKEIEDKFNETKDVHIYTMMKTTVLRSLYEDLEELCNENNELYTELENYRAHDKFYKSLKKKLHDEDF